MISYLQSRKKKNYKITALRYLMKTQINLFILIIQITRIKPMKNRSQIADFSNPYSQRNRKIMAHLSKGLSPKPLSKSPLKPEKQEYFKASISNISEINKVKQINQLKLGKERMNKVRYTLEIEEKSRRGFEHRKKLNDYYFKYQPQQLSKPSEKNNWNQISVDHDFSHLSNKQIVGALRALQSKDLLDEIKQRIDKLESNASNFAHKLQINYPEQQKIPIPESNQQAIDLSSILVNMADMNEFKDLDNIVSIKEENFFFKQLGDEQMNLFTFRINPKSRQFDSGWQKLKKIKFAFRPKQSLLNKKVKDKIYNDLSTYSRIVSVNRSSKLVPNEFRVGDIQDQIDENNLEIESLLMMADGLNQGKIILRTLIEQEFKQQNQKLSDITNYPKVSEKDKQKRVLWQGEDINKTEIPLLKEDTLNHLEKKDIQYAKDYLKNLNQIILAQVLARQQLIRDQRQTQKFEKEKNRQLEDQLNQFLGWKKIKDAKKHEISSKTLRKDKSEHFKTDLIVKSFKQKQVNDNKLQSRSPSKTRTFSQNNINF